MLNLTGTHTHSIGSIKLSMSKQITPADSYVDMVV